MDDTCETASRFQNTPPIYDCAKGLHSQICILAHAAFSPLQTSQKHRSQNVNPTLRLMVRDRTSCWSAWHAKVSVSLVSGGVSGRYSCRGRQRRTSVRALLARSERCNRVRVLLLNFKTMFEEDDTQRDSKQTHTYHQPQHCIPQEFQRPWKRFSTIIRWQALNVKPLFGILCANPRDLDPHLHL